MKFSRFGKHCQTVYADKRIFTIINSGLEISNHSLLHTYYIKKWNCWDFENIQKWFTLTKRFIRIINGSLEISKLFLFYKLIENVKILKITNSKWKKINNLSKLHLVLQIFKMKNKIIYHKQQTQFYVVTWTSNTQFLIFP